MTSSGNCQASIAGQTLLPKTKETKIPKNYCPITCLPTTYNTSIITERTYEHLESNAFLPDEQKGCKKRSYRCKHQLLINQAKLEEVRTKKKSLTTAWVDYKKAFDSVLHDWIMKCLTMYKISPVLIDFLEQNMKKVEYNPSTEPYRRSA